MLDPSPDRPRDPHEDDSRDDHRQRAGPKSAEEGMVTVALQP